MSDNYGNDIARAVHHDAVKRELLHRYEPTPTERREAERQAQARAFEQGDHMPDGTVLPPGMKYERTPTGCWLGKPATEHDEIGDYTARLDKALGAMETALRAPRARGNKHGIVACGYPVAVTDSDGCDEVTLSVQVFLRMDRVEAERLRAAMADHPDWLEQALRGMQLEAGYALQHAFGVVAKPVE